MTFTFLEIIKKDILSHGEILCADIIYYDRSCFHKDNEMNETDKQYLITFLISAEQQTKIFNILRTTSRHDVSKHRICFYAVATIISSELETKIICLMIFEV